MSEIESTTEHFETAEILNALERGFSGEDRLRALLHFGGGCPVCADALAGLAERERNGETPTQARQHRDFVARALERWHRERRGTPAIAVELTPIHHAWLQRPLGGGGGELQRGLREPGTFCRLALEEARLMALQDPKIRVSVLSEALEVVSDPRLRWIGERRWHDLRALSAAYAAGAWRVEDGEYKRLRRQELDAKNLLEQGTGDPEAHAVVFLSLSWMALRTLNVIDADWYLRRAEEYLERSIEARSSPGHLAELRVAQGMQAIWASRYAPARERYTEAYRHLPERCARLRLLVLRCLAAVSDCLNDRAGFRQYLAEAERLAAFHGLAFKLYDDEGRMLFEHGAPRGPASTMKPKVVHGN